MNLDQRLSQARAPGAVLQRAAIDWKANRLNVAVVTAWNRLSGQCQANQHRDADGGDQSKDHPSVVVFAETPIEKDSERTPKQQRGQAPEGKFEYRLGYQARARKHRQREEAGNREECRE